jgi:hypothetical protein
MVHTVRTGMLWATALFGTVLAVRWFPDLRRYLRMRRM